MSPGTLSFVGLCLAASCFAPAYGATISSGCTPGTLDAYIALGGTGCAVGVFDVKNFAFSSQSGGNFVSIGPGQVNVAPALVGSSVAVNFGSTAFNITGNQKISAFLDYTIDPAPPILDDMGIELSAFSPVAPGFAKLTADICAGALLSSSCAGGAFQRLTLADFGTGSPDNVLSALFLFPAPVNLIDVRLSLDMQANGASSQINGFGSISDTTAPEPSTAASVLGAALAGAVVVWRRRRHA